jgi:hypothetical protein
LEPEISFEIILMKLSTKKVNNNNNKNSGCAKEPNFKNFFLYFPFEIFSLLKLFPITSLFPKVHVIQAPLRQKRGKEPKRSNCERKMGLYNGNPCLIDQSYLPFLLGHPFLTFPALSVHRSTTRPRSSVPPLPLAL